MTIEQTLQKPATSALEATAENITEDQIRELDEAAQFTDDSNSGIIEDKATEERPEWLQEQFKTPEDLAKAYQELRSKMDSGESATTTEENTTTEKEGGDPSKSTEEPIVNTSSESVASAFSEYSEKGELSEDTYKTLEKEHGFDKGLVDAYIAGQAALQTSMQAEIKAAAGGNPEILLEWGKLNLTPEQVAAHDKAMNGSLEDAKNAIELLKFKFDKDQGSRGAFHGKGSGVTGDSDNMVFFNQEDIVAAMKNPNYDTSETYRKKVEEGIRRMF